MKIGYFLSCEEFTPAELVAQARAAEGAGFEALWISDHFHPWIDEQGQSPFVWSVIGALVAGPLAAGHDGGDLPDACASTRRSIAQAAATTRRSCSTGRFSLGVGTGEALNEHILGDHWPSADVRLEMLEEAVAVMRELWTGEQVEPPRRALHRRERPHLHAARTSRRRSSSPASARRRSTLAARIGDGYMHRRARRATIVRALPRQPAAAARCSRARRSCWGADEAAGVATAHRHLAERGPARRARPGAADAGALRAGVASS